MVCVISPINSIDSCLINSQTVFISLFKQRTKCRHPGMQLEKVGKKGPPLHGVHLQQVQQTAARKKTTSNLKDQKTQILKIRNFSFFLIFGRSSVQFLRGFKLFKWMGSSQTCHQQMGYGVMVLSKVKYKKEYFIQIKTHHKNAKACLLEWLPQFSVLSDMAE